MLQSITKHLREFLHHKVSSTMYYFIHLIILPFLFITWQTIMGQFYCSLTLKGVGQGVFSTVVRWSARGGFVQRSERTISSRRLGLSHALIALTWQSFCHTRRCYCPCYNCASRWPIWNSNGSANRFMQGLWFVVVGLCWGWSRWLFLESPWPPTPLCLILAKIGDPPSPAIYAVCRLCTRISSPDTS